MPRRDSTIAPAWFEALYRDGQDPWGFATSDYERAKYEATLAAIGWGHRDALEIGCAIGVFTHLLAERCDRLLAVDAAENALASARQRCTDRRNITFRRMNLPEQLPQARFDLVTLSEVGYYWTPSDLDRFLVWLTQALRPTGLFVLVHWTGETDYPQTGDQVHERVAAATRGTLRPVLSSATQSYRLDAYAGL